MACSTRYFLPRLDLVLESAHVSVALDCDHAALLGARQLEPLVGMPLIRLKRIYNC
jgi:hypothetical protein